MSGVCCGLPAVGTDMRNVARGAGGGVRAGIVLGECSQVGVGVLVALSALASLSFPWRWLWFSSGLTSLLLLVPMCMVSRALFIGYRAPRDARSAA